MRTLDDAVRSGKILSIGISDAPTWIVSRANTLAEWRGWRHLLLFQLLDTLVGRCQFLLRLAQLREHLLELLF